MGYINYFSGIVKVLEIPTQTFLKDQITITRVRAQFPQFRNNQFITLQVWGNLALTIKDYYKPNDYILIEGYISIRNKTNVNVTQRNLQSVNITVLKIYPFILKSTQSNSKV